MLLFVRLLRASRAFVRECNIQRCSPALHAHPHARPRVQTYSSKSLCDKVLEQWSGYGVGIEQAVTLPASWYTSPRVLQLEQQHVFYSTWQMVCDTRQFRRAGDYTCGTLGDVRYVIVLGQDGQLRAFHNVCRHHAAAVAQGAGNTPQFTCPYHNWTYDDKGRLIKATRLKGIKDFKASQYGLHPIRLDTWGHMVFIHLQGGRPPKAPGGESPAGISDWLGAGGLRLQELGMCDPSLVHIARREYVLNCNWKVFCDNYLDGGYHVPYAHPDLASNLDLSGYKNELHDTLSIQIAPVTSNSAAKPHAAPTSEQEPNQTAGSSNRGGMRNDTQHTGNIAGRLDRLTGAGGRDAGYAFVYPNLMINRYGPWMDTNVVIPFNSRDVDRCRVIFNYWLEADALQQAAATVDPNLGSPKLGDCHGGVLEHGKDVAALVDTALRSTFVEESLASSHQVQVEDIALCEAVQIGLQEPAYGVGRYAPGPEAPMYHFHELYYSNMQKSTSC